MTTGLCIIADDLTGALDAAAPFAGRGLAVQVWLDPCSFLRDIDQAWADGLRVFAISTDSRDGSAAQAQAVMRKIASALPPNIRIFKKIDSRMKGHIATELAALQPKRLLVAPAIPDFGRIVRAGHVTGFGVNEPIAIAPLLGDLAQIADIPDSLSRADMQALVENLPEDMLLVGAKGLAEALACKISGKAEAQAVVPRPRKALIAIGSRDPITQAQVAALRGAEQIDYRPAPNGEGRDHRPLGRLTLLQATQGSLPASAQSVAEALAVTLTPLMPMTDLVFITGGATAQTVLASIGISHMTLLGECFAGVPIAAAGGKMILTKSGGFGEADILVRLAALIPNEREGISP